MIDASQVTACLVTRGDQPRMMARIVESLLFSDVVIWDNSIQQDMKTAGRYYAMLEAGNETVYFQDDDVLVPQETQQALLNVYEPGTVLANWGHGENPDGYDDLPLVCGGALVDSGLPWRALNQYLDHYPYDGGFLFEADFIAGVLYPSFTHVHLPFDINLEIAQDSSRLVNQPWQKELKLKITNQARQVRDMVAA